MWAALCVAALAWLAVRANASAPRLVMQATLVTQHDIDPTSNGTDTVGTLWWPSTTLAHLVLDVVLYHHSGICKSKVSGCVPQAGVGWDDAYPMWESSNMPPFTPTWYTVLNKAKSPMPFMVNGTYFYKCNQTVTYENTDCQWTAGLIVSGGKLFLPETQNLEPRPLDALMMHKDGSVTLVNSWDIPGGGPTSTATFPKDLVTAIGGNILFTNGTYNSDCNTTCHEALSVEPRTIIAFDGLSPTNTIYFLVLQPGRFTAITGATAPQATAYLTARGLKYGFMLDGGGSSGFVYPTGGTPPASEGGDAIAVNGENLAIYRPVTNVFGIRGTR